MDFEKVVVKKTYCLKRIKAFKYYIASLLANKICGREEGRKERKGKEKREEIKGNRKHNYVLK